MVDPKDYNFINFSSTHIFLCVDEKIPKIKFFREKLPMGIYDNNMYVLLCLESPCNICIVQNTRIAHEF